MQVQGFSAAAVAAGIRYPNRLDLGLIFSAVPAVTAGAFTTNIVKAAPLQLDMERLRAGMAQAVVVNSGNANACTGAAGMETARAVSTLAADALAIEDSLIQVASTGVIGQPMPLEPFSRSMVSLVDSLSPQGFTELAQAMMTTDTRPKTASARVLIDGVEISILGVAKGSGMIMPDMATMLCFVVTDARIDFPTLDRLVKIGVEQTFNRITVDGDTSTNDMVLVMANGLAGNVCIDAKTSSSMDQFGTALQEVFRELALMVVADGEGATKMVTIRVTGAESDREAVAAARTIANSALVKTAFFGEDANWGRIIAALGRSGCTFNPDQVSISFDAVLLVTNGQAVGGDTEAAATAVMQQPQFAVTVHLHQGHADAEVYTCDFSFDYVKINADYRS